MLTPRNPGPEPTRSRQLARILGWIGIVSRAIGARRVPILGVNLVAEVADVATAADPDAVVSLRFHSAVVVMGQPRMVATVYLINPEGKIRLSNRGTPSPDAVLRSVVALKQATRRGL